MLLLNHLALFCTEIRIELAFDVGDTLMQQTKKVERVLLLVSSVRVLFLSTCSRSLLSRLVLAADPSSVVVVARFAAVLALAVVLVREPFAAVHLRWVLKRDLR